MGKQVEASNELWFRSNGNRIFYKYSSPLFLLFPLVFLPENLLGLCMKPSCHNAHTSLEILVWQSPKASAAERKGRSQSSCLTSVSPSWHPACSGQSGKTNGKWSLPIQLLQADFVFQREAVLYFLPCLSFYHVSSWFFWGEGTRAALGIAEADVPWIHTVAKSYFSLLRILSFWFSFFFLTAIEQWGGMFVELAIKTSRCIS